MLNVSTGITLLALFLSCLLTSCTLSTPPPPAQPRAPVLLPTVTPEQTARNGPTAEQQALLATLRSAGPAPELANEVWFNGEPLKLADLRGKVVMVEFWTYGCINCQHVLPYVQEWYAKYKDEGFAIIGVHTPEFAYEKELGNVEAAIGRLGVTWPVAIDNDWATWRAYGNHYWPAAYFIDKAGNIRQLLIGEGHYDYAEEVIQALLAEEVRE
ncbi:MAG TPA: redoxin domain-containing protein [Caldilineaceae bacterium]|nr:redoxin domain-containing protein [Caldilineaceae bacterium]